MKLITLMLCLTASPAYAYHDRDNQDELAHMQAQNQAAIDNANYEAKRNLEEMQRKMQQQLDDARSKQQYNSNY